MSTISEPYAETPEPPASVEPFVLGLTGLKRSGKDTFATMLAARVWIAGGQAEVIGMSDDLAQCLYVLNPHIRLSPAGKRFWGGREYVSYRTLFEAVGYEAAKEEPEVRELLQRMGTDVMRDIIAEDTWGRLLHEKIQRLQAEGVSVIATGIRYPSDAEVIQVNGGIVVEVRRAAMDEEIENLDSHSSEQGLPRELIAGTVYNDSDLDTLKDRADKFGRWIMARRSPVRPS